MCRVLGVSTSGHYVWLRWSLSVRAREDEVLRKRIATIHAISQGTYGAPRNQAELRAEGIRIGCKRVARLMREAGLQGVSRRKWVTTTERDMTAQGAADPVQREFRASGRDRLWVADITYVPTWDGVLYLAVVLDVWSRLIVGWTMATHQRTELVLEALDMAVLRRCPDEVIHHSDHGCQHTSIAFGQRCREAGVKPSMGSVGDCFDNVMREELHRDPGMGVDRSPEHPDPGGGTPGSARVHRGLGTIRTVVTRPWDIP
jgi:putative transposase